MIDSCGEKSMSKKLQYLLLVLALDLGLGLFGVLILTWLVSPEPVTAQSELFVRGDGNDSCDGLANEPAGPGSCAFATIQYAINQAVFGDTVTVVGESGAFAEAFTIDKSLNIVGISGATVSVDQNTICAVVDANDVTIEGLTFTDCDIAILAEAEVVTGYTGLRLINNTVYNTDRFGVYLGIQGEDFADGSLTALRDFSGLEVINNTIYDTGHAGSGFAGLVLQGMRSAETRHNISRNEIYSVTNASAIWIDTAQNISVRDNDLHDNLWGIYLSSIGDGTGVIENGSFGPRDIEIISNNLRRNTTSAVRVVDGWPAELTFQYNAIADNTPALMGAFAFYNQLNEVTAQNNWWGCNAGPSSIDCDTFNGDVNADPWLILDLTANPSVLQPDAGPTSVALTATLTHNSDGVDTSGSGYIPDGTEVAFESSVGVIDPPALTVTTMGVATATIPIDPSPGSVVISATVDHQIVTTTIHIPNIIYYFPIIFKNSNWAG